ncbi:hypothetical protein CVT25_007779 [Psilocybe cyanescens]|uniref:Uncharacterized protein n=1 Tax=Psilocybe cyanescens TaxID=93625 RepID=A0A409XHZ8_PSICY|nr:hypothetical protein CVT25_007779 [Psilocybe cyanescens]
MSANIFRKSAEAVVRRNIIPHHVQSASAIIQFPSLCRPQRNSHNLHTIGMLKEDQKEIMHKPRSEPHRPLATSGDYSGFGTNSEEYHCLDTDPTSETSPYEFPRNSGRQLRYGGMQSLRSPWDGSWKEPTAEAEYGNKKIGRIS